MSIKQTLVSIHLDNITIVLEESYKRWCLEYISYYSTETTWKYDVIEVGSNVSKMVKRRFLTFWFGDPIDATAFKLRFGL